MHGYKALSHVGRAAESQWGEGSVPSTDSFSSSRKTPPSTSARLILALRICHPPPNSQLWETVFPDQVGFSLLQEVSDLVARTLKTFKTRTFSAKRSQSCVCLEWEQSQSAARLTEGRNLPWKRSVWGCPKSHPRHSSSESPHLQHPHALKHPHPSGKVLSEMNPKPVCHRL